MPYTHRNVGHHAEIVTRIFQQPNDPALNVDQTSVSRADEEHLVG
jgi:hypothetical protein